MRKAQEGYLLVMAVLLILVMGVLSVSMSGMSAANSASILTSTLEAQSYYVAESGINLAARYWATKNVACSAITDNVDLTNASIGPGVFTVTGAAFQNSTTLSANITSTATTIPLTSGSGFPSSGAITIGSEGIFYTGISGNNLTGAFRGVGATTAAAQTSAAVVTQNQCVLTSTGSVSNQNTPLAQRTLQATMFTFPGGSSSVIGSIESLGDVNITNGSVANGHSCLTCSNYPGANIQTNSTSNTFVSFTTQVDANAADGGNLTTSSSPGSIKADITQGTSFNGNALYRTYFAVPKGYFVSNAPYRGTNVLNRTGVIYADKNVNISNGSLGTPANPVLMYVAGSLTMTSVTVYGLIYATGNVTLSNLSVQGAIATESNYSQNGVGFVYNYSMLSDMTTNPNYSAYINAASFTGGGGETRNHDPANKQEKYR